MYGHTPTGTPKKPFYKIFHPKVPPSPSLSTLQSPLLTPWPGEIPRVRLLLLLLVQLLLKLLASSHQLCDPMSQAKQQIVAISEERYQQWADSVASMQMKLVTKFYQGFLDLDV